MRATRREILKALGLGPFALPLLPAAPARAAGTASRLLCVVHTGGYRQLHWRPPDGPLTGPLPFSAAPLEPWKNQVIFLPGLANPHHRGSPEGAYPCVFYGLAPRTAADSYAEPLGKTVDQVVAGALPGGPARALALHVQIDLPPVPTERGATRCSWAGPDQPVVPAGDPTAAYQRLFAGRPGDPGVSKLLLERKSVLDVVGKSLQRWRERLGHEERHVVEGHLQAVREFETTLGRNPAGRLHRPAGGGGRRQGSETVVEDPRRPAGAGGGDAVLRGHPGGDATAQQLDRRRRGLRAVRPRRPCPGGGAEASGGRSRLAGPGPQRHHGRHRQQAPRRPLVDGEAGRPAGALAGRPGPGRHPAGRQRGVVGQPDARRGRRRPRGSPGCWPAAAAATSRPASARPPPASR